jgi:hemerythrin superfamily protein
MQHAPHLFYDVHFTTGTSKEHVMIPFASKLSPSITSMIRMDHTHVISTFHQYSPLKDTKTRQALANVLCRAVSIHSMLEEEILYPALRSVCPDQPVLQKSAPEHDEMRHLISVINASSAEHPDFDDHVMQLMRRVLHHVADEETTLLPIAETRLSHARLCELGVEMTKRRMELVRPYLGEVAVNTARGYAKSPMLWAAGTVLTLGLLATRH